MSSNVSFLKSLLNDGLSDREILKQYNEHRKSEGKKAVKMAEVKALITTILDEEEEAYSEVSGSPRMDIEEEEESESEVEDEYDSEYVPSESDDDEDDGHATSKRKSVIRKIQSIRNSVKNDVDEDTTNTIRVTIMRVIRDLENHVSDDESEDESEESEDESEASEDESDNGIEEESDNETEDDDSQENVSPIRIYLQHVDSEEHELINIQPLIDNTFHVSMKYGVKKTYSNKFDEESSFIATADEVDDHINLILKLVAVDNRPYWNVEFSVPFYPNITFFPSALKKKVKRNLVRKMIRNYLDHYEAMDYITE